MSGWWVHNLYDSGQTVLLVSWIAWVIFSIVMHELAHGWAALWQGDETPRRYGHMTMNPIVHMGWPSLLMFAVIGIAWGMMPTDPSQYRWKRRGRIVVAAAGPAMNVLLALVSLTAAALWSVHGPRTDPLHTNVLIFLLAGGWLNLALAAFNLLPIPPLDGSSILMGASWRFYQLFQQPQAPMIGMFILLAIFLSGVGGLFFGVAMDISEAYVHSIRALIA